MIEWTLANNAILCSDKIAKNWFFAHVRFIIFSLNFSLSIFGHMLDFDITICFVLNSINQLLSGNPEFSPTWLIVCLSFCFAISFLYFLSLFTNQSCLVCLPNTFLSKFILNSSVFFCCDKLGLGYWVFRASFSNNFVSIMILTNNSSTFILLICVQFKNQSINFSQTFC